MTYVKDPRVDAYLDGLLDWQREILRQVRGLVHAADPDVQETIKRTVQPYFVLDGNICAFLAAKDHVNPEIKAFTQKNQTPDHGDEKTFPCS